ncbi:MAG: MgtC/SapB family protein [Bacteroidales bacterium]
MQFLQSIPAEFLDFLLVTVFSLIVGLSQKNLHQKKDIQLLFGTDRTFTFIGILGYILFSLNPYDMYPFLTGAAILSVFFAIYYVAKIRDTQHYGMTTILIALIVYASPALLLTKHLWMYLLVMVTVIMFSEMKEKLTTFSKSINREEFVTLAKFLIIAGIILPVVPDTPIVDFLTLTPYRIWLAVVVISSISYVSYLTRKFIFPRAGIILSGILGGLYSSTATTLVLARKSKESAENKRFQYVSAIIFATSMMYLRILLLILIFNKQLFRLLFPYFVLLFFVSLIIAIFLYFKSQRNNIDTIDIADEDHNPLEFRVALLFTFLFVAFSFITWFSLTRFGKTGLSALSFIVGITDIDPFLINLFQGKYNVGLSIIGIATMQAIVSNNLVKMMYAILFGKKNIRTLVALCFLAIIAVNLLVVFIL